MNNSLRYLVVVSLALGFTTSVVCAEAAVHLRSARTKRPTIRFHSADWTRSSDR